MILPPAKRSIIVPVNETAFPVGGIPIRSPLWVPRIVQRTVGCYTRGNDLIKHSQVLLTDYLVHEAANYSFVLIRNNHLLACDS